MSAKQKKREQKGKRNCVWYGKIVDSAKECQRASQHINDSFNERQSYICCVTWTNRTNFINILYSKFICRVWFFFAHSASISCNVCVCESVPISRGHTSLYLRSFFLFIGSPEPTSTYKLRHITMFEVFRLFSLVSLSLSWFTQCTYASVCECVFVQFRNVNVKWRTWHYRWLLASNLVKTYYNTPISNTWPMNKTTHRWNENYALCSDWWHSTNCDI